jgi:hypothetical protein
MAEKMHRCNVVFVAMVFRDIVLATVFLSGNILLAQRVDVGVEGGIRTTGDFSGGISSESKRYMVGPAVDVRLTKRVSV